MEPKTPNLKGSKTHAYETHACEMHTCRRCTPMRCTPMRCTVYGMHVYKRCTPTRCASMRCMFMGYTPREKPVRCTLIGCILCEIYASIPCPSDTSCSLAEISKF